jgi:hypothetical protein
MMSFVNYLNVLVCNWPHSVGQNHFIVKMLFNRNFASQKSQFPASRSDDVSSRPDAHLSKASAVRTTCHIVRTPDRLKHHPSGRHGFPFGPSSVSRSFCSSLHPSGRLSSPFGRLSVSTKLQTLSKIKYGKIAATVRKTWILVWTRFSLRQVRNSNSTVRTMWIPVRTHSFIRQESQFKYNRSDVSHHGPDACSTDMEITFSTSTVRTPAYNGPGTLSTDMEIAC